MKKILKFIWEDLKSDWQFVDDVIQGKKTLRLDRFKREYFDKQWFLNAWLFLLLLSAVFLSGWGLSAIHSQNLCNDFIMDEFYSDYSPYIDTSQFNINFSEIYNKSDTNNKGDE